MTTQQRNLLIGAVVIVAIAGAVMLYMQGGDVTQPPAAETENAQTAGQAGNRAAGGVAQLQAEDFSWEFRESEEKDDVPQTRVSLVRESGATLIGTYAGTCTAINTEKLLPGEVTGVLCWYAGGGDEIGVFKEGGKYVVKAGVQEESTADSAGFRGNFKTVLTLD